ncbi:hypothetical protein SSPO_020600 [Streptomyces antimycoticus]|uniref:Uncharacterized protein n=1 Tax=Streptomyces antimycoticus TaxID=68175 RepID=A0A499UFR8_9ACTN|nr:hypothetical protein SSPO_020600 [Streptomyces antimycoticus]
MAEPAGGAGTPPPESAASARGCGAPAQSEPTTRAALRVARLRFLMTLMTLMLLMGVSGL